MTKDILNKIELLKILSNFTEEKDPLSCWIFKGFIDTHGYGQLRVDGKLHLVHRLSLYIHKDFDLNSKLLALHTLECKYRNCWNPEHLYAGTRSDNQYDSVKAGTHRGAKKTHCPKGHPYSNENKNVNGARICKICSNLKANEYYKKITAKKLKLLKAKKDAENRDKIVNWQKYAPWLKTDTQR